MVERRATIWAAPSAVVAEDGITFLPQPEETVVRRIFTDGIFAHEDAAETNDTGHNSPAFAARWMQDVWPLAQAMAKAA